MLDVVWFVALGLAYGFILQRSRLCFAAALRDLWLTRAVGPTLGVLGGMTVATLGFAATSLSRAEDPASFRPHLVVLPVGLSTVVGGLLFGAGMVIAGNCASGCLYRIGEGYLGSLVSLLGVLLGSVLAGLVFLPDLPGLMQRAVWLPELLGYGLSVGLTLALLAACMFWVASRASPGLSLAVKATGNARADLAPWVSPVLGGVGIGAVNVLQIQRSVAWGVTDPFIWLASQVHASVWGGATFAYPWRVTVLDFGLITGALLAAALSRELALRVPKPRRLLQSLAGGALIGLGLCWARGCNIGGLFSALPSLSLSAWLFLPALATGAYLGLGVARRLA